RVDHAGRVAHDEAEHVGRRVGLIERKPVLLAQSRVGVLEDGLHALELGRVLSLRRVDRLCEQLRLSDEACIRLGRKGSSAAEYEHQGQYPSQFQPSATTTARVSPTPPRGHDDSVLGFPACRMPAAMCRWIVDMGLCNWRFWPTSFLPG